MNRPAVNNVSLVQSIDHVRLRPSQPKSPEAPFEMIVATMWVEQTQNVEH